MTIKTKDKYFHY